jgi:Flp pilus assembly protein TadD
MKQLPTGSVEVAQEGSSPDQHSHDPDAWYAHGNALWWRGEREAGIAALARAVALRPDHADARNNLGNALLELGRPAEAVQHLGEAVSLQPDSAPCRYNLGNALAAAGQVEDAIAWFRSAISLDPNHAGAWNNLGNALRDVGQPQQAEEVYRRALALRPDLPGAHCNLGVALLAQHRPAEAAVSLVEALRLQPDYPDALNNLAGALLALDRPEEALPLFRRAFALDPAQAQARFGEALALLTLGRYREGWEAYESRWLDPRFREDAREYPMPPWLNAPGSDIAGQTVLLHAEQGLGDTIQFVRYAALVRRLGARVALEVQSPLVGLLRPLADAIVEAGADLPPADFHCPMLSLPHAFHTELVTVPAQVPYLRASPERLHAWREALGPPTALRIGIAFGGSSDHPENALRSIPAAQFLPALSRARAELHLIQRDIQAADADAVARTPGLHVHGPRLDDFADTAALVTQLDLVVSVDTSVAHLAGALGRPVWVLLQSNADFRWLRAREDSPWYPTARLFRQSAPRQWGPALARVAEALRLWVSSRG